MRILRIINRIWDKLLVTIGVLCALLPTSPLNMPSPGRDSGVFLYIGWRILNGELPYRDIWDHKPPVIFYLNALGLAIADGSRWGVWIIEFIAVFFAAFIGFKLVKRSFGAGPAVMSLFLWLVTLVFVIDEGNRVTEYALPLQFILLWLVYDVDKRLHIRWFLVGTIIAISFFTKQTTVGIGIAIILYLTIHRIAEGQMRRWIREVLFVLGGFLTIVIVTVAFFYLQGALGHFWSAAFKYNLVYSIYRRYHSRFLTILFELAPLSRAGLLQFSLIGYVTGLLLVRYKRSVMGRWCGLLSVCLLDFPIELILVSVAGIIRPHYLMTLLPVLSIFAGLACWVFFSQLSYWGISKNAKSLFVLGMAVAFSWSSLSAYYNQVVAFRGARQNPIVSYIRAATSQDEYVLLWGAQTEINYLSQRRSPTRFAYQYALYNPKYVNLQMVEEFLNDVISRSPKLIIDTRDPLTPMYEFPVESRTTRLAIEFLRSRYRRVGEMGTWTIYEYAGEKTAP